MLKRSAKKLLDAVWTNRYVIVRVVVALILAYITMPITVFASDYTAPLDNFKTVMITLAKSAGTLLIIWAIISFGLAWKKQDQHGEFSSIATGVAGAVIYAAGTILPIILGTS